MKEKKQMNPIKTHEYQYLGGIIDWYLHYRGMDSHSLALKLAKEKTAEMWYCEHLKAVEVLADYLTKNIDRLLRRSKKHEA